MAISEAYKKAKETHTDPHAAGHGGHGGHEAHAAESHVSEKTFSDILNDDHDSKLLLSMLNQKGGDYSNVLKRLTEGKTTDRDLEFLEGYRKEFNERMKTVEKANTHVTLKTLEQFSKTSPAFKEIINLAGPEKALSVIQSQMAQIAMEDPEKFKVISDKIGAYASAKENMATKDHELAEKLGKLGISESKYVEILSEKDNAKRVEQIKKIAIGKYEQDGKMPSKWWKLLPMLSWGRNAKRRASLAEIKTEAGALSLKDVEIDAALTDINTKMTEVATVFGGDLKSRASLRSALAREVTGMKKEAQKESMSFKAMRDGLPSDEVLGEEWETYKKDKGWAKLKSDQEKDAKRDEFLKDFEAKHTATKPGFWGGMFASLANPYYSDLPNKKDKLK